MDFSYTEEQEAVRELARQILADRTSHERSKQLETSGVFYDDELWNELVQANLVALAVPETHGGGGLGITEVCILLEEAGRHVAPVPLLPTVVLGALPIAEFGSDAQKQRWLTPVSESGAILTAALDENGSSDAARPRVTARRDGDGWRLDGEKVCVPAGHRASAILVPASIDGGVGVFLLEPQAEGVKLDRQIATHHEPQALMQLSGARVDAEGLLGDPARGREIVEWIVDRALLGYASMQLGSCQAALHATAEYLRERKQFGKPIGSFQAAQMRAADAYIDVESMRSVLMEAIWRLDAGLRARAEIVAAKWWAARGGDRVVHTAQHLHGGIGSDVDYPIHRYFLWSQYLGTVLGGGNRQLAHLGKLLVSDDERPAL